MYNYFNTRISQIITHPLIFERFYWLLYVTWCKSPDTYHAITPVRVDICRPIVSVKRNIVNKRISTFLFSYLTWKETKLVLLSLAIVTLKSAVPESTTKSPKYAVNVFEVKKVTSRLLIFSPT